MPALQVLVIPLPSSASPPAPANPPATPLANTPAPPNPPMPSPAPPNPLAPPPAHTTPLFPLGKGRIQQARKQESGPGQNSASYFGVLSRRANRFHAYSGASPRAREAATSSRQSFFICPAAVCIARSIAGPTSFQRIQASPPIKADRPAKSEPLAKNSAALPKSTSQNVFPLVIFQGVRVCIRCAGLRSPGNICPRWTLYKPGPYLTPGRPG